jgi:predicted O-linked N-acetylglucosamine transferase (SPINDLY family)
MAQSQFDVLNFNEGLKYFEDSLKYDCSAKNLRQYLFNSLYVENFDLNKYLNLAKKFTSIVNKQKISDYKIDLKNNNLIIGFISGDFKEHAVAYQITGLIRELKKYKDIKLFAYYNNDYEDNKTQELKSYFDKFENIFHLNDDLLIKKIVEDKINILIDLSGYSSQNRLSIFLAKPAPVQVTGFGFLKTTGLKEIDYILADKNTITDTKNFTEEVLVDQETWSTLDLNNIEIKVEELPAKKNRYITFGAFNNFNKLNEETFKLWAKILKNVKDSKILLNNHTYENIKVKDYIHSLFEKNNIPSSRIIIENGGNREKILNDYNKIDILLDTYPYGGGTTSLESAWMCVPILTISGNSFVSRGATSVNLSLGMPDWNCKNKIEYLEKAINFSSDIDLLSEIKSQLIKKRKAINIFDNVLYAKNFYFMMRNIWNKYLEQNI